uniref:Subtilisin-like protease SBT1.7 n=1 Tax=Elaeis guineensis var. tenera TaxID=51953 RepID=A0A6I9RS17_ELAGV|nr:subtilisin-like protease SBT1.7 [Elaeis guineensis]
MTSTSQPKLSLLHLLLLLSCIAISNPLDDDRRPYIIHMDPSAKPLPFSTHESWYNSILSSLPSPPGTAPPQHLYTYSHVMHGFSAVLSSAHVEHLARIPGHVAIHPDSFGRLHTTRTPKFLGLNRHLGLWPMSNFGDEMIIGIIDTGIWPESDSFDDKGMPPIPERWKGTCETGTKFNSSDCNRKLIGARSFSKGLKQRGLNVSKTWDYDSPRDNFGHGTHTSSTAAGARSTGAEYFEYAKGNAIGIAPMARLAMYKVLFAGDTFESAATDVLAGMDQAIADGVDLMSLSLGFPQTPYYSNVIALGAFAAMERGIFVSCSAGNSGPDGYTIFNGAPWITTVGAGTIDRDYVASITLGQDFATVRGNSFYPVSLYISGVPLYHGLGDATKENCRHSSLDAKEVNGTIVFCSYNIENNVEEQIGEVARSGAKGAIIATDRWPFMGPSDFSAPLVVVAPEDEKVIKAYIARTKGQNLTVDIVYQLTEVGTTPAPKVADFSSRGPNAISPEILKPDILAPGVNVLAAWARAPFSAITSVGDEPLISDYVLLSGTSMASPHVVGVAALLRSLHREWSPAAIRSAIMTTANVVDNTHQPITDLETGLPATPLDFGAGHINPNKAMDPGLIYDIGFQDYVDFLCGLNYSSSDVRIIIRRSDYTCQANLDLNYPSFIVISDRMASIARRSFKRVLTSVMDGPSTYRVVVAAPVGMRVVVEPHTLTFDGKYSKQEFSVSLEVEVRSSSQGSYGFLSWSEVGGKHVVRSPIVFAFASSAK